jgi:hypothetical protein
LYFNEDLLLINYKEVIDNINIKTLGYCIQCNQNDVIEFLVENKISFNSTIHNLSEILLYDSEKRFNVFLSKLWMST